MFLTIRINYVIVKTDVLDDYLTDKVNSLKVKC